MKIIPIVETKTTGYRIELTPNEAHDLRVIAGSINHAVLQLSDIHPPGSQTHDVYGLVTDLRRHLPTNKGDNRGDK